MKELWAIIPDCPNYAASNLGRIKRLTSGWGHTKAERILKPQPFQTGYIGVWMYKSGIKKFRPVHSLVLSAWVGPRPIGKVSNHKNAVRNDARLENLEYVTPSENTLLAFKMGNKIPCKGELNGSAKLKQSQADQIRWEAKCGRVHQRIADDFGISRSMVWNIANGKNWK